MWADLRREVADLFVGLARVDVGGLTKTRGSFSDRHDDADRWVSATDEEREALRPVFEKLLEARRRRLSAEWKPGRRDRAAYMRRLRQREDVRAKDRARSAAWRQANKERAAENLRRWRAKRKAS
jgi:hypothetical protein